MLLDLLTPNRDMETTLTTLEAESPASESAPIHEPEPRRRGRKSIPIAEREELSRRLKEHWSDPQKRAENSQRAKQAWENRRNRALMPAE